MKMAESSQNGYKTMGKGVMSNFSFSHSDFKRLVLETCKTSIGNISDLSLEVVECTWLHQANFQVIFCLSSLMHMWNSMIKEISD